MPILVEVDVPLTPQEKEEVIAAAVKRVFDSLAGYTDRDGKAITVRQALPRGAWTYDQIREGGFTDRRLDAEEAATQADDARLDRVEDALDDPILPRE